VIGFRHVARNASLEFPISLSGFAVRLSFLKSKNMAHFLTTSIDGMDGSVSDFVRKTAGDLKKLQCKGEQGTRVMVWETETVIPSLRLALFC
jgi:hypothetical protein